MIPPEVDAAIWSGHPLPAGLSATPTGESTSPVSVCGRVPIWNAWANLFSRQNVVAGQAFLDSGRQHHALLVHQHGDSSARLYWENTVAGISFFAVKGVKLPVAVSVFPDEMYEAPKSWTQRAYPNLIHYNELPKGGHFAAWEQPEFITSELRTAFKALR